MRKKIIICSNILWTITQFRFGLIKALINSGYEVICIADIDNFSSLSENKITNVGAKFIKLSMTRKGINPFKDIIYFSKLYKILKKEKPDIVFNYTIKPIIYGSIAAKCLNIPSFAITTGLGFVFIKNDILTKFVRLLYTYSLRFPKKIFFLNKDDAKVFIHYKIVDKSKTVLLPGEGVDTIHYCPENESPKNKTITFLLFARLLWDKGVGEYVEAAKMVGNSNAAIILKYIIPNTFSPIVVRATIGISEAILDTAALGFLGLGVQPPQAEWGSMLGAGRGYIYNAPHILLFPGIFITITVLAFNLFGDGLRDALDPKFRK